MNETGPRYTAAIAADPSCCSGQQADVCVIENDVSGCNVDDDGNEIPVYTLSDKIAMECIETSVCTDPATRDDDKLMAEAEGILAANGWTVTGTWQYASDGIYATVERA